MVLNRIEELLTKYEDVETTLQEEQELRDYFTSDEVAPHLEYYRPLFQYFAASQKEEFTKDVPLKTRTRSMYQWISVAAVSIIMLGIFLPRTLFGPSVEEEAQVRLAYKQTMEALSLVSAGMNKGKQELTSLALLTNNLNDGMSQASRLGEFTKATNKIFKNN
ncbi:MAG: hypothetical protein AAGH46_11635 [Bacteroidota bacterium]